MPKRILLADDSITIQKVVELTFSDGDYEIVSANNGVRALQKLAESMPDVILSDIIMPEKNGYEVCEFVKSHPEYRDIPVILLTGTFEPFDPDRAEKAGCDAVVTKPFESQSLINKVEELIQKRRARDEESRADRGADSLSQPLDSVDSPPAAAPQTPSAQSAELGATMPWQMPTVVDETSQPEPEPDSESPLSAEAPSPGTDAQDDSPFGSDGGWQPTSTPLEAAAEEPPAEPFDATPPEDAIASQSFDGDSIFAPEDASAATYEEVGDRNETDRSMSEPAPGTDGPTDTAGESLEGESDDLSTRAWAVPIDGAWAEADVKPEPEGAESGNTLPFPPVGDDDTTGSVEAGPIGHDEASPSADLPVDDGVQSADPWNDDSVSATPVEQMQEEPAASEDSSAPQDVWAVEPHVSDTEEAHQEMQPQTDAAWESGDEDMMAPQNEASHESDVHTAAQANRSLSDEDVERIARRVVELISGETVKNIAWEVVPDIAEMVVRERVRELENE